MGTKPEPTAMIQVKWNDDLSIGCGRIDDQHKYLFELFNRLGRTVADDADAPEGVVAELIAYAENHFREEEKLMEELGFPGRLEHLEDHGRFMTRLVEFELDELSGKHAKIREVTEYLVTWIMEHICEFDKELGNHLKSRTCP